MLALGSVTVAVEVRGNIAAMTVDDRAVLFSMIDLVNDAMKNTDKEVSRG